MKDYLHLFLLSLAWNINADNSFTHYSVITFIRGNRALTVAHQGLQRR